MDIIRGICMAIADSVPGVSGGTIAFLLGFYEKFVSSVNDFLLGSMDKKKAALPFLLKLGAGWVGGFLVCAVILSKIFAAHIYELSSLFLGLTLLAIPIVIMEERAALKGKYYWLIFTAIGIAVVPLLVQLNSAMVVSDLSQMSPVLAITLFVAAILAVSVMVLPGISGSTLLLIFGLYVPLISAVSALVHLDFTYVPALVVFGIGGILGLALCTKIIRACFERFHSQTIYLVIGLLAGSLYAISKGAETLSVPQPPLTMATFSILFFILGAGIMVLLQWMKIRAEKKEGKRAE